VTCLSLKILRELRLTRDILSKALLSIKSRDFPQHGRSQGGGYGSSLNVKKEKIKKKFLEEINRKS